MPFKDLERKREYDRQRMARLFTEGRTWWQQRDRRPYDEARHWGTYGFLRRVRNLAEAQACDWDRYVGLCDELCRTPKAELYDEDYLKSAVEKVAREHAEAIEANKRQRRVIRAVNKVVLDFGAWKRFDMALIMRQLREDDLAMQVGQ